MEKILKKILSHKKYRSSKRKQPIKDVPVIASPWLPE
jgi:hypothetical protein